LRLFGEYGGSVYGVYTSRFDVNRWIKGAKRLAPLFILQGVDK